MSFAALHRIVLTGLTALSLASPGAHAHDFRAGDLSIDHPYALPSLPGIANGAVYLRGIQNKGSAADRLLSASTPRADRVELHTMSMDGDVMRMRALAHIDLPAGQSVALGQGQGHHLMLMGLKKPLTSGERFELTLRFEKADEAKVDVWVQKPRVKAAGTQTHQH